MSAHWQTLVANVYDRTEQHRPLDRETVRAAARELRQRGLTPLDIADALKLSEAAICELLEVDRG
jgi:hypothetical protein